MATSDAVEDTPERRQPFEEQSPFLWNSHKFYGYISGVGAGKTAAGVMRTALNANLWNPGEMGAIVAPTTTMIKDVIIPLMREWGLLDRWTYKSSHTEEPGLHTPEGGRILILSADNQRTIERLAGLNLAYWWIDEGARVPARAIEILEQRLRVGQYRNGYVTTTPMGYDHIYDFFVGERGGETREYGTAKLHDTGSRLSILNVPTFANPHTPKDFKDEMEQKSGQVFDREVMGEFTDFEGLVYKWFDHENRVPSDQLPETWDRTIYGVDWGGSAPTAIVALRESDGEWYAVDEFYERRVVNDTIISELERMERDHNPGPIFCDTNEPRAIEQLSREGFDAREAEKSVDTGIRYVSSLRDQLYVSQSCQHTIEEFNTYQYKDGGNSDTVLKENDHLMDALRYALFTDSNTPTRDPSDVFGAV